MAGGLGAAGLATVGGNAYLHDDEPEVNPEQQEINQAVTDEFGSPQGKLPADTIGWKEANGYYEGKIARSVTESINSLMKENSMYKNGILSQKGVTAVNNSNAQTEHERFLKKYTPNFTKRKKLKEYTGDFGYSDDPNYNKFAQQNRPQQKQTPPLANYQPKRLGGNLVSNDGGESYMWDDSQQR
jgi:hypothetical protein